MLSRGWLRALGVALLSGAFMAGAAGAQAVWSTESSYPVRGANRVKILIDGETAFTDIVHAIDRAKVYCYVTFAFLELDFRPIPEDSRTIRDILVQAAQRGVDVRVVIWSSPADFGNTVPEPKQMVPGFDGGAGTVQARWDVAKGKGIYPAKIGCHHQKSFMMDSPTGDLAYVGGMNSLQSFWDTSSHDPADPRRLRVAGPNKKIGAEVPPLHDMMAQLTGPICQDVISNFRERYNQATYTHKNETQNLAARPLADAPDAGPEEETPVQLVRTIAPKTYASLPNGERSIREAYLKAIASAQHFIYIEDQYLFDTSVIQALKAAAKRGVKIIALLTRNPNHGGKIGLLIRIIENGRQSAAGLLSSASDNMAVYTPVTTTVGADGKLKYRDVYVHAKDMIVDDRFVTLGSANLSTMSMEFHSELNILLNDPAGAQDLRARLWAEHLQLPQLDPAVMADPAASFNLWKQHADANVAAWKAGQKPPSRVFPARWFSEWTSAKGAAAASDLRAPEDAEPEDPSLEPITLGEEGAPAPE